MIMDRLPLVQALTAAGIEHTGAENVATALGDAIEPSVATNGDLMRLDGSIARVEARFSGEIARLELAIAALENCLTLRLGGIIVATTGVLFALLRFAGHAP